MTADPAEPTLADDEATLAAHALALVDAAEAVLGEWIRWSIADRAPHLAVSDGADAAAGEGATAIAAELRSLLSQDIDDQPLP